MEIKIIKNYKGKKRTYLKNQELTVMPWLANDLINRKVAEIAGEKVETTELIHDKEKR